MDSPPKNIQIAKKDPSWSQKSALDKSYIEKEILPDLTDFIPQIWMDLKSGEITILPI